MKPRRALLAAFTCLLALGGVLTVGTGTASAATCGKRYNVDIPGGRSSYLIQCGPTTTRVSGWLEDTSADGKCVQVRIWWPAHESFTYTDRACPKGTRVTFEHNGRTGRTPPSVTTYTIG
ncbi:hypothetical protein ACFV1L_17110 [Kitasatospora sp. NPDC059646]|uniref:hypothetical protein n=1 Tax=Kitasatospora sp. NPDC059646 TaxID=3346893 RepID=UPI0036B7A9FC